MRHIAIASTAGLAAVDEALERRFGGGKFYHLGVRV